MISCMSTKIIASVKSFHQNEGLVYPKIRQIPDQIMDYATEKFPEMMHFYDEHLIRKIPFQ